MSFINSRSDVDYLSYLFCHLICRSQLSVFPLCHDGLRIQLQWLRSLWSLHSVSIPNSGLKDLVFLQLQHRSHLGWDSIPCLGTSICYGCNCRKKIKYLILGTVNLRAPLRALMPSVLQKLSLRLLLHPGSLGCRSRGWAWVWSPCRTPRWSCPQPWRTSTGVSCTWRWQFRRIRPPPSDGRHRWTVPCASQRLTAS